MGGWRDCHCRRGVRLRDCPSPIDFPLNPSYLPDMKNTQLKSVHNGAFMVNDAAAADPVCQAAMASYMESIRQETARRNRIRQGLEPADDCQWGNWTISDRH